MIQKSNNSHNYKWFSYLFCFPSFFLIRSALSFIMFFAGKTDRTLKTLRQ